MPDPSQPSPPPSGQDLAVWKRRLGVFLAVAIISVTILPQIFLEVGDDNRLFVVDDVTVFVLALIIIGVMLYFRKSESVTELTRAANIGAAAALIAVALKLLAISIEFNDPADFGDEIPLFVANLVLLGNRWL